MIAGVKKCLDAGDIKGLRYIFLDSLDVDPTFEKYKDDYSVCRSLDGMFEPYVELTPLSTSHSEWDMDYWVKIKFDQKKNFSQKRFEHMIEVAKVVHAEKIERLLAERAAKQTKIEEQIEQVIPKASSQLVPQPERVQPIQSSPVSITPVTNTTVISEGSISESDKSKLREDMRDIDLHNQRVEQEELEKKRKREAAAKEIERQNALLEAQNQSKKVPGIVAVIAVIILIVVVVLLLKVL
ncbi:MAG: hypothetical protein E7215_13450 [Clostridium sulfidigenes]|uniref:Uncharacterized protein n=1 Tax=Clostridium sulfidigenes TaxID=318464 RepID=A0A927W9P7_9CLOT|nr:hypothetical protein [Clostridium sulfidigenes]